MTSVPSLFDLAREATRVPVPETILPGHVAIPQKIILPQENADPWDQAGDSNVAENIVRAFLNTFAKRRRVVEELHLARHDDLPYFRDFYAQGFVGVLNHLLTCGRDSVLAAYISRFHYCNEDNGLCYNWSDVACAISDEWLLRIGFALSPTINHARSLRSCYGFEKCLARVVQPGDLLGILMALPSTTMIICAVSMDEETHQTSVDTLFELVQRDFVFVGVFTQDSVHLDSLMPPCDSAHFVVSTDFYIFSAPGGLTRLYAVAWQSIVVDYNTKRISELQQSRVATRMLWRRHNVIVTTDTRDQLYHPLCVPYTRGHVNLPALEARFPDWRDKFDRKFWNRYYSSLQNTAVLEWANDTLLGDLADDTPLSPVEEEFSDIMPQGRQGYTYAGLAKYFLQHHPGSKVSKFMVWCSQTYPNDKLFLVPAIYLSQLSKLLVDPSITIREDASISPDVELEIDEPCPVASGLLLAHYHAFQRATSTSDAPDLAPGLDIKLELPPKGLWDTVKSLPSSVTGAVQGARDSLDAFGTAANSVKDQMTRFSDSISAMLSWVTDLVSQGRATLDAVVAYVQTHFLKGLGILAATFVIWWLARRSVGVPQTLAEKLVLGALCLTTIGVALTKLTSIVLDELASIDTSAITPQVFTSNAVGEALAVFLSTAFACQVPEGRRLKDFLHLVSDLPKLASGVSWTLDKAWSYLRKLAESFLHALGYDVVLSYRSHSKELDGWINSANILLEREIKGQFVRDAENLTLLADLCLQANRFLNVVPDRALPTDLKQVVKDIATKLERLRVSSGLSMSCLRGAPTVCCIRGPSFVGKSTGAPVIAQELLAEPGFLTEEQTLLYKSNPSKAIYPYRSNLEYADGFEHNPIIFIDDFMQRLEDASIKFDDRDFLIVTGVPWPVPAHAAAIEDKGKLFFTPKCIMITTNDMKMEYKDFRSRDAVINRMTLMFDAAVHPDFRREGWENSPYMDWTPDYNRLPRNVFDEKFTVYYLRQGDFHWRGHHFQKKYDPQEAIHKGTPYFTLHDIPKITAQVVERNASKFAEYQKIVKDVLDNKFDWRDRIVHARGTENLDSDDDKIRVLSHPFFSDPENTDYASLKREAPEFPWDNFPTAGSFYRPGDIAVLDTAISMGPHACKAWLRARIKQCVTPTDGAPLGICQRYWTSLRELFDQLSVSTLNYAVQLRDFFRRFFWYGVLVGGGALLTAVTYFMWPMLKEALGPEIPPQINLSDSVGHPVAIDRRRQMRRKQPQKAKADVPAQGDVPAQSFTDKAGYDVAMKIQRNVLAILGVDDAVVGHILMLCGRSALMNRHIYAQLEAYFRKTPNQSKGDSVFCVAYEHAREKAWFIPTMEFLPTMKPLEIDYDIDVVYVEFPDFFPEASSITHFFFPNEEAWDKYVAQNFAIRFFHGLFKSPCMETARAFLESGHTEAATKNTERREVPVAIRYNIETFPGDCGRPVFLVNSASPFKILGIHFGGKSHCGYAEPVFLCDFEKLLPVPKPGKLPLRREEIPAQGYTEEKFVFPVVGVVPPVQQNMRSEILPSKLARYLPEPTRIPATIWRDPKNDFFIPMLQKQMKDKYPPNLEVMSLSASLVVRDIVNANARTLSPIAPKVYTAEFAAITSAEDGTFRPLPTKKYPGWLWKEGHDGPLPAGFRNSETLFGKATDDPRRPGPLWPELLARITHIEQLCKEGVIPAEMYVVFPKDELRTKMPDGTPKVTREIDAGDKSIAVLCRMYFGAFTRATLRGRLLNGCALGMNANGDEYHVFARIFDHLKCFDADLKQCDSSLHTRTALLLTEFIDDWYKTGLDYEDWHRSMRLSLVKNIFNSYRIVNAMIDRDKLHDVKGKLKELMEKNPNDEILVGLILEVLGSNSTGSPITALITTLCVLASIYYAYILIHREKKGDPLDLQRIRDCIRAIVQGDDHIIARGPLGVTFNPREIAEKLSTIGIEYVPADKKSEDYGWKPFAQCSFLKRKPWFSPHLRMFVGALDLDVCREIPLWILRGSDDHEQSRMNIETAALSFAQHPEPIYRAECQKHVDAYQKAFGESIAVMPYEDMHRKAASISMSVYVDDVDELGPETKQILELELVSSLPDGTGHQEMAPPDAGAPDLLGRSDPSKHPTMNHNEKSIRFFREHGISMSSAHPIRLRLVVPTDDNSPIPAQSGVSELQQNAVVAAPKPGINETTAAVFLDSKNTASAVVGGVPGASVLIDSASKRIPTREQMLARKIQLDSRVLTQATAIGTLTSFAIPGSITSFENFTNNSIGYGGFRATQVFRSSVASNPFVGGCLRHIIVPTSGGVDGTTESMANIVTASQHRHSDLDINCDSAMETRVRWFGPANYYDLLRGLAITGLGTLFLYLYAPISGISGTNVTLITDTWLEDVEFFSPGVPATVNPRRIEVVRDQKNQLRRVKYHESPGVIELQSGGKVSSKKTKKSVTVAAVKEGDDTPVTDFINSAKEYTHYLGPLAGPAKGILDIAGAVSSAFGWSHTDVEQAMWSPAISTPFALSSDGPEFSVPSTFNRHAKIEIKPTIAGNDADEMQVTEMVKIPTYLQSFLLQSTDIGNGGTQYANIPLQWTTQKATATFFSQSVTFMSPGCFFAGTHAFHRGAYGFRFRHFGTEFHSARLVIAPFLHSFGASQAYTLSDAEYTNVIEWDTAKTREINVVVPYTWPTPWMRPLDYMGQVMVWCKEPMQANANIGPSTVVVECYACPDFMVSTPKDNVPTLFLWTQSTAPGDIQPQSGASIGDINCRTSVSFADAKPDFVAASQCVGDLTTSVKQWLGRYHQFTTLTSGSGNNMLLRPITPAAQKTTLGVLQAVPHTLTMWDILVAMYAFYSGSTVTNVQPEALGNDCSLCPIDLATYMSARSVAAPPSVVLNTTVNANLGLNRSLAQNLGMRLVASSYCAYNWVRWECNGLSEPVDQYTTPMAILYQATNSGGTLPGGQVYRRAAEDFQLAWFKGIPPLIAWAPPNAPKPHPHQSPVGPQIVSEPSPSPVSNPRSASIYGAAPRGTYPAQI